jgi:hypothetical protein
MILSWIGHFLHGTAGVDSGMNEYEGRRLRSARADDFTLAAVAGG